MKIGIDCRLGGSRHAGIGRYVRMLVTHVLKNTDHQWVLFCSDNQQAAELLPDPQPQHVRVVTIPIRHYSLLEQILLPFFFYKEQLDLLHVPHFNAPILYLKKTVITIHDLLWHQKKGTEVTTLAAHIYWIKYFFYRVATRCVIWNARVILVPSKVVKKLVGSTYGFAKHKIRVTYEGAGDALVQYKKNAQKHRPKQLLYVGSLYPHKNVALILHALQALPDHTLVIVTARSIFLEKIKKLAQKLNVSPQVVIKTNISDTELATEYQHAEALIQPSFSEGFGLTGIEAMTLDTPVIASDIPIFREIYGSGALYFNPKKTTDFIEALNNLPLHRKRLITSARQQAAVFSWERMAEQTLTVYETV